MAIELEIPDIRLYTQAVYALLIDDQYIYIGSSKDIRVRFSIWKSSILRGKVPNPDLRKILPTCKKIKFEIIEKVREINKLGVIENYYIVFLNDLDHPYKDRIILNKNSPSLKVSCFFIDDTHPIPKVIPYFMRNNFSQ